MEDTRVSEIGLTTEEAKIRLTKSANRCSEILAKLRGLIGAFENLPEDASENLHDYLYHTSLNTKTKLGV